jgi:DNA-directed RNA polymerase specialized sigma subunit
MIEDRNIRSAHLMAKNFYSQLYQSTKYLDYREVMSEAMLGMMEGSRKWKANSGTSFNTWICDFVQYQLRNAMNRKWMPNSQERFVELVEEECQSRVNWNPEAVYMAKETLNCMSETAREIARIVLSGEIGPSDIHNRRTHDKNAMKRAIKNKLREKGWSWGKIQAGFSELRAYANSLM